MSSPEQAYGAGTRPYVASGQAPTAQANPHPDLSSASAARTTTERPVRPGPRKVRLTLSRVDPWSVAKLGFLVSVAIGIALVVMIAVLWMVLDGMGVFSDVDRTIATILGPTGATFDITDYVGFGRVLSLATVVAVIDVFLLTALSTLGAFVYNLCSVLVGGVQVTLTDD